MKTCKVCRRKPHIKRRMDNDGNVFCSEDCFEKLEGRPDDFSRPYIDDYEMLWNAYIDWIKNYEGNLHKSLFW